MAVGKGVTGFAVGDRVGVIPAFSFAEYGMYGQAVKAFLRSLRFLKICRSK